MRYTFHIGDQRPGVLAPPLKEGRLADAMLAQQVGHRDPDSASLRIPTIWLSLNFDFLMTAPSSREQSTFECLPREEAYELT